MFVFVLDRQAENEPNLIEKDLEEYPHLPAKVFFCH
jgi:hypothetical protein